MRITEEGKSNVRNRSYTTDLILVIVDDLNGAEEAGGLSCRGRRARY